MWYGGGISLNSRDRRKQKREKDRANHSAQGTSASGGIGATSAEDATNLFRERTKELRVDIPVTILFALFPWGWQALKLPEGVLVGIVSWIVCLALVGRIVWVAVYRRFPARQWLRWIMSMTLPVAIAGALWHPISGHLRTLTIVRGEDSKSETSHALTKDDLDAELKKLQVPPAPTVPDAESDEAAALNTFIGGKEEFVLDGVFDFDEVMELNIRVTTDRITNYKDADDAFFDLTKYKDEYESMMFNRANPHIHPRGGGYIYELDPHDVSVILLSHKYDEARERLATFKNSGILPLNVIAAVSALDQTVDGNMYKILTVL
jgi:hypothetical protein